MMATRVDPKQVYQMRDISPVTFVCGDFRKRLIPHVRLENTLHATAQAKQGMALVPKC